jgi:5-methylcytosine-specific restriction enzyme A
LLSVEPYQEYFESQPLSEIERDILIALAYAGARGLTASEVAHLVGMSSHVVANRVFGGLGHKISDHAGLKPEQRPNGTYRWWRVLADDREEQRGFVWMLHSTVLEALSRANIVSKEKDIQQIDEEAVSPLATLEGATKQVSVNAYERNPIARKRCISHWGSFCQVCGFDFESIYGEMGQGFIHVHHIIPLSAIKAQYEVNPLTDLIPVCANCHAMIHRTNPPLSVEALRKVISSA